MIEKGEHEHVVLDVPVALMVSGHMVGIDEDMTMITFVQGVPSSINMETGKVITKYETVSNVAMTNKLARDLAVKILENLSEMEDNGPIDKA